MALFDIQRFLTQEARLKNYEAVACPLSPCFENADLAVLDAVVNRREADAEEKAVMHSMAECHAAERHERFEIEKLKQLIPGRAGE